MIFTFSPMTEADVRAIGTWQYEGPYRVYSLGRDGADLPADDELLDRRSPYFAVHNEADELVGFFCFGWMLYRHRDLVDHFGRGWRLNLLVANVVVLPVALVLLVGGLAAAGGPGNPMPFGWKFAGFVAQAVLRNLLLGHTLAGALNPMTGEEAETVVTRMMSKAGTSAMK